MVSVKLKAFLPFVNESQTIEKVFSLRSEASIEELIVLASEQGVLRVDRILNGNDIKEGVVILVNGRTVFNLNYTLNDGDKVVIMPLVSGG